MKVFHCKWPNKDDSKNNEFEYRCGTDVFETYYKDWDPDFKNYLNHINEINDPILKHISIYFVQHYINGYRYYHESGSNHRNTACQYLKHWLQEKKDLFTYGETCQTKIDLWDKVIGNLWDVLKNQYTVQAFYGKNPWCKKTPLSEKTEYPRELPPFNCEESLAQEPSSADPSSKSVPTECNCQNVDPVLTPPLDQAPEKDLTKNIAVTSGFTAVGTLGTLFFLYRYTPVSSWFRRRGMNNIGSDLYMNPGSPDDFLRMQHDNVGNNLFYHPSV